VWTQPSGYNLARIKVYCDHGTYLTWRGGRQFALELIRDCPNGKTPALLLTNEETVEHLQMQSDTEFITVVKVGLVAGSGSAVKSYLAKATGVTAFDFEELKLSRQLRLADIREWLRSDSSKLIDLAELIGEHTCHEDDSAQNGTDEVLSVLRQLLTTNPDWLRSMSLVLSENLKPRMNKVQEEAAEFEELLKDTKCGEDECQTWLEAHPWILGLEYTKVRPRQSATRGKMDFLLERYDGFHDLLELKDPQDAIIIEKPSLNNSAPPPSHYSLSPAVANALAQAHSYRLRLTEDEAQMLREHKVSRTRHPRMVIIVGRDANLTDHGREVLAEFNRSLHRVEIIPYDKVVDRAQMLVRNIEAYLFSREREVPPA
jgi:hypothetical protein